MISTGVSVLVRSASSRRYALITLRPFTVTSFESPPVTLILPRGFSKTMRFMPAALAVADTGKSYCWPQKSRPPRMNRTPCSRACQMPLPAMQIRIDQHDLAAREAAAHAFAMPDQPFHQPQQPPRDQHERPVLRQQVEDGSLGVQVPPQEQARRWRAATEVRKTSVSYRVSWWGRWILSGIGRPRRAGAESALGAAAAAHRCSARSCPAAGERSPAADTRTPAAG